jgi:hypothetical protein
MITLTTELPHSLAVATGRCLTCHSTQSLPNRPPRPRSTRRRVLQTLAGVDGALFPHLPRRGVGRPRRVRKGHV